MDFWVQGLDPPFYLYLDDTINAKGDKANAPLRISGELVIAEMSLCSEYHQYLTKKATEAWIFNSLHFETCLTNDYMLLVSSIFRR